MEHPPQGAEVEEILGLEDAVLMIVAGIGFPSIGQTFHVAGSSPEAWRVGGGGGPDRGSGNGVGDGGWGKMQAKLGKIGSSEMFRVHCWLWAFGLETFEAAWWVAMWFHRLMAILT